MKMITAIVNKKDTGAVCRALTDEGFEFTKLATTGGFLRDGNTTLLIGVADERLQPAIEVIRHNCAQRLQKVPALPPTEMAATVYHSYPAEVMVGGAIVFVSDVLHFEKM
ncbi:MAG: cyclic-di-AMP receptor [Clostridia bacterium]|nr:cyclic-di-AMP receptor [Clostridia bacterium]